MGSIRYDFPQGGHSGMELLYISESEYDGTWHSIMHTHPHVELFYCLDGKGRFHVRSVRMRS